MTADPWAHADEAYEKAREIKRLGASSGWPCQAVDDERAAREVVQRSYERGDDDVAYRVVKR